METISGGLPQVAADDDSPLPVAASLITPPVLAGLLAEHAYVYRVRTRKADSGNPEPFDEETTPARDALGAVLAGKCWPEMPPLRGVIGAPVLRRDGTRLQQPGYDPTTGLYLASWVALPVVLDHPTPEQVRAAREFLLGKFLADFPWSTPPDRANYIALLVTPILRHYTRSLTPFGLTNPPEILVLWTSRRATTSTSVSGLRPPTSKDPPTPKGTHRGNQAARNTRRDHRHHRNAPPSARSHQCQPALPRQTTLPPAPRLHHHRAQGDALMIKPSQTVSRTATPCRRRH